MSEERERPPQCADERTMLEAWLDYHRATLALKCEGLAVEQLRQQAVAPSTLSLLGLVRHLAQVERNWFRRRIAGEEVAVLFYPDSDPYKGFGAVAAAELEESFAAWRAECDYSRAVLARVASLDDPAQEGREGQPLSVRWILLHVLTEYARHNGHADLLRERLDGTVGV